MQQVRDDGSITGGTRIEITSSCGTVSTYFMHLETIAEGLEIGSNVTENFQIGTLGGSGFGRSDAYNAHLHYEIRISGERIDPANSETTLLDPQSIITPVPLREITVTAQAPNPIQPIVPNLLNSNFETPTLL